MFEKKLKNLGFRDSEIQIISSVCITSAYRKTYPLPDIESQGGKVLAYDSVGYAQISQLKDTYYLVLDTVCYGVTKDKEEVLRWAKDFGIDPDRLFSDIYVGSSVSDRDADFVQGFLSKEEGAFALTGDLFEVYGEFDEDGFHAATLDKRNNGIQKFSDPKLLERFVLDPSSGSLEVVSPEYLDPTYLKLMGF